MLGDLAKMNAELARLGELDFVTLKARWRSTTGRVAPAAVQRALLLKMLAYRIQAEAFGDLDPDTARFLDRVVLDRGLAGAKTLPLPDKARAGQGAIFVREWEGVTHQVMHMNDGYAWNGSTYRSLSEVARAITGVRLERAALLRAARQRESGVSRVPASIRRCAVYTRVSTDHRLEQDFNSLDAQREAAEAYVRSQNGEGWKLVKNGVFSDGGFSGGSMERPALQRLLELVRSRGVDVIVVYKVDRLTRSLADFAKLVELFDANGVSFVSVTQSFNTTTSMGRLTLNMLLSFAQFEREVTGERIRDKIAASKKRGIWIGGVVPLGYRVEAKKLVVDEVEAATVQVIFERYLALGSLSALQRELRERGVVTRQRTLASGRTVGGVPLTNGPLAHLLANRVYLGEINHKGQSYPAEHPAIVPEDLFEAVAAKIAENRNGVRTKRASSGAMLLGRLFDDRGNPMTPSVTNKKGVRYRYYVSCVLAQGRGAEAGSVKRISAPAIESAVIGALRSRSLSDHDDRTLVADHLSRAILSADNVELSMTDGEVIRVALSRRSSARSILGLNDASALPMKAEARAVLLRWIALGRRCVAELERGRGVDLDQLATRQGCSRRHVERMIDYAFLAPNLVKAIADGRLPRGVTATALADAPMLWSEQWRMIGLGQPGG